MEENAKQLVQQYINGWKENNAEKITQPLSKDIVIIESHGPRYKGVNEVKKWIAVWKKVEGKVISWDITAFYFDEKKQTVCFQWDFHCMVNGQEHQFLGMSTVRIVNNKITYLHEYRMTQDSYDWNADMQIPA